MPQDELFRGSRAFEKAYQHKHNHPTCLPLQVRMSPATCLIVLSQTDKFVRENRDVGSQR